MFYEQDVGKLMNKFLMELDKRSNEVNDNVRFFLSHDNILWKFQNKHLENNNISNLLSFKQLCWYEVIDILYKGNQNGSVIMKTINVIWLIVYIFFQAVTLGSQEGAFENVRMSYSGDQGQQIRQLVTAHMLRRVAMCVLASPQGKRQHLAVSHEKGKITILQLSALLKQADSSKKKLTLTVSLLFHLFTRSILNLHWYL